MENLMDGLLLFLSWPGREPDDLGTGKKQVASRTRTRFAAAKRECGVLGFGLVLVVSCCGC